MSEVLTTVSGWAVVVLLPIAIALPLARSRRAPDAAGRVPAPDGRIAVPGLHYWLGFIIAVLALAHAAVSTGTGLALRVGLAGIYLATAALLLVFVQVFLGLLLREPSVRGRPKLRRRHFWIMVGIVALAIGHIVLNSGLLH